MSEKVSPKFEFISPSLGQTLERIGAAEYLEHEVFGFRVLIMKKPDA